jgi:hypothetical protein
MTVDIHVIFTLRSTWVMARVVVSKGKPPQNAAFHRPDVELFRAHTSLLCSLISAIRIVYPATV